MAGAQPRTSYRSLWSQLEIRPVPWQRVFSLMNFNKNNEENNQINSSIYSISTSNNHNLHRPNANLSCLKKKSTFYASIKIFKFTI